MNRWATAGLLLVIVGVALLTPSTFGGDSIVADRLTTFETTDDPDALLGVHDNSDSPEADVTPPNDERGTVFYLDDNAEAFDTIDAEIVAFEGGDQDALDATVVDSQDSAFDYQLDVICDSDVMASDVTVTVAIATEGEVAVELERESGEIDVQCQPTDPGGFEDWSAGDVAGPGPTTQTITFTMEGGLGNGDTIVIDLVGLFGSGIDYTDAGISEFTVGGSPSNDDVSVDGSGASTTVEFTVQGNLPGGEEVEVVLDGVEPGSFNWFGIAQFEEPESGEEGIDFYAITPSGGNAATTADEEDVTVSESDIAAFADELDGVDETEIRRFVAQHDGVEIGDEEERR